MHPQSLTPSTCVNLADGRHGSPPNPAQRLLLSVRKLAPAFATPSRESDRNRAVWIDEVAVTVDPLYDHEGLDIHGLNGVRRKRKLKRKLAPFVFTVHVNVCFRYTGCTVSHHRRRLHHQSPRLSWLHTRTTRPPALPGLVEHCHPLQPLQHCGSRPLRHWLRMLGLDSHPKLCSRVP